MQEASSCRRRGLPGDHEPRAGKAAERGGGAWVPGTRGKEALFHYDLHDLVPCTPQRIRQQRMSARYQRREEEGATL